MLDFLKKFNCFEFDLISPKRDSYHIFISRKLPAKDLELTEHRGFGEKTFKAIAGWHDQNESQRRPKLMERRKALKSLGVEARVHYDSNAGAQGAGEGRGAPRGRVPQHPRPPQGGRSAGCLSVQTVGVSFLTREQR